MKKKIMVLLVCTSMLLLALSGCSSGGSNTSTVSSEPLTIEEISDLYQNPDAYKGRTVEVGGRIFNVDGSAFQFWRDPMNNQGNTIVDTSEATVSGINRDAYVIVRGTVQGAYEGTNSYGGTIGAVMIKATDVQPSDYQTVVAPAIKTVEINQTIDQYGCVLSLEKVEFSDYDTRFYLTATNNSSNNLSLYSFNAKAVQNGTQYQPDSANSYYASYPEFSGDILPGVTQNAIIAFPKMNQSSLQLVLEAYSSDYTLNMDPYMFDVTIQ